MPPVVVAMPDVSNIVSDADDVLVDFLMPNGIIILMKVDFHRMPLEKIKQDLWQESTNFPLYDQLLRSDAYSFLFLNQFGEREEILHESQCLSDIKPSATFLKLVQKEAGERHYSLERRINSLIGKGLQDMTELQTAEVADFRNRIQVFCDEIVQGRDSQWEERFRYRYPPRLCSHCQLPIHIAQQFDGYIVVDILIPDTKGNYKFRFPGMSYPKLLIEAVLKIRSQKSGVQCQKSTDYMLKVCGLDEYLHGDYHLQQFKYIYNCLLKNIAPQVSLVLRSSIPMGAPAVPPRKLSFAPNKSAQTSESSDHMYTWSVENKVCITVKSVSRVVLPDGVKVKLVVGLYHGGEVLCDVQTTEDMALIERSCVWNMQCVFDIAVADLPEMARFCFMLYSVGDHRRGSSSISKSKKFYKDSYPFAWVNVPVFDFRSRMMQGDHFLYMWPTTDDMQLDVVCYPIGPNCLAPDWSQSELEVKCTVTPNTDKKMATTLSVHFPSYNTKGLIVYPPFSKVLECAAENMEAEGCMGSSLWRPSKSYIDQLRDIIEGDPLGLSPMFEQDKDLIWLLRHELKHRFPESLSKLLCVVKWTSRIDVSKMQALVQSWPQLPAEQALELLDCVYPDKNVRKFAVSCLHELTDDDVSQYLLQLIQVLKYESYLYCPLVEFLLSRALRNQRIGHTLFWLLKSEVHCQSESIRFGLILQAYCKASYDHTTALIKQNEALKKLNSTSMLVKNSKMNSGDKKARDRIRLDMQKALMQNSYKDALSNLHSPLSSLWHLKGLIVNDCKFLDSKKRPLWLVWENLDDSGIDKKVHVIYKNGDDLRQDMLTLQIIQIVDSIWQEQGLDLRMSPYGCICTGPETGMIEVVLKSETIANIQKWYDKGSFDKRSIYEWLRYHNKTEESLARAVKEFTLSCAGYCVLTYVLGIGDRHNDNIMVKTSGQLFHIDFGHFLGNFKSKFGMKRERVPFVLTTHFVYVIQNGPAQQDENFEDFQKSCEEAYLILRSKGHLLVTLFMMMLSSGIPELTCVKDVDYLKTTLALNYSEEEAIQQFRAKFKEALKKCWTTIMNWYIHMQVKDNT